MKTIKHAIIGWVIIMSFDGILLRNICEDLNTHILNHRITKIYQLSKYDLLFTVRGQRTHSFIMSTSPQYTRTHRTLNRYEKPDHPPMFCMFLRKHLEGAIIEKIEQHGNDRVLTFTLRSTNELGDLTHKHLIFEALGKDANIIVTGENDKILDALSHTGPFDGQDRTITPSAIYQYPNDTRINPFDETKVNDFFNKHTPSSIDDFIQHFSGISPLFIKEFLHRNHVINRPLEVFNAMIHEKQFRIIENKKTLYTHLELTHIEGTRIPFDDVQSLMDAYFYERDLADKRKQKAKDMSHFVKRQIEKLKTKKEHLSKDLVKAHDFERFQHFGELLLSYQHTFKKGDREVTILNYYTNEEVIIPLDVKKTPIQNSAQYFKKAKKLKTSVRYIKREQRKTREELAYFNLIDSQIEHANLNDLEDIREELESAGYLKKRKRITKRPKKASYSIYEDALGLRIMVGKNNLQNAQITHKDAKHFYVWFHVQNSPGSHVVVESGFPLEETTIRTCAHLAAYFSKMRHASSVPVDYTEIKHIKKIPGKRDCFVRYTNQKTIYIDPEEDIIKNIKVIR